MVAELATKHPNPVTNATHSQNRVLHVLIRRHGTSQTFGENLIFMLNRASRYFLCMLWLNLSERAYQVEPLRISSCNYWS
jgi:hypothetical protein